MLILGERLGNTFLPIHFEEQKIWLISALSDSMWLYFLAIRVLLVMDKGLPTYY